MFQPYFHKETINLHGDNLKKLFDLNFGKDWRLFISLFHSKHMGKHWFSYQNVTDIERAKYKYTNLSGVIRDAYYSCCVRILNSYLNNGYDFAKQEIEEDKYRFKWGFKKGEPQQIIVSDELYEQLHPSQEPPASSTLEMKNEPIISDPSNILELHEQLNEYEEKYQILLDKQVSDGLTEEEEKELKQVKSKANKLSILISREEANIQS